VPPPPAPIAICTTTNASKPNRKNMTQNQGLVSSATWLLPSLGLM
jgi:hypothetical protein